MRSGLVWVSPTHEHFGSGCSPEDAVSPTQPPAPVIEGGGLALTDGDWSEGKKEERPTPAAAARSRSTSQPWRESPPGRDNQPGTPAEVRLGFQDHGASLAGPPAALGVAIAAVDRFPGSGLEGHLGLFPASGADRGEEMTLSGGRPFAPSRPTGPSAVLAAGRLVLEAFLRVEGLFTSREEKFLPTLPTREHLVLKFHR